MRLILLNYGWVADGGLHLIATAPGACQHVDGLGGDLSVGAACPRIIVPFWQILQLHDNLLAEVTREGVQFVEDWQNLIGGGRDFLSNLICRLNMSTEVRLADVLELLCEHGDFANYHIQVLLLLVLLIPQSLNHQRVIDFLGPDSIEISGQPFLLQLFAL